jgi:hypothetical protein
MTDERHEAMMGVIERVYSTPQFDPVDVLGDVLAFLGTMRARPADFVQTCRNRAMSSLIIDGIVSAAAVRYAANEGDAPRRHSDEVQAQTRMAILHIIRQDLDGVAARLREAIAPSAG